MWKKKLPLLIMAFLINTKINYAGPFLKAFETQLRVADLHKSYITDQDDGPE